MIGGRRVSLEESQPQGETEQLDAQQADVIESDPSDSSDDDYQPIPQMAPRPHDREASGSSFAPP